MLAALGTGVPGTKLAYFEVCAVVEMLFVSILTYG